MNSTDTTLPDQIIQLLRESYPHLVKLNDIAKRLQIVSDTPEYNDTKTATFGGMGGRP